MTGVTNVGIIPMDAQYNYASQNLWTIHNEQQVQCCSRRLHFIVTCIYYSWIFILPVLKQHTNATSQLHKNARQMLIIGVIEHTTSGVCASTCACPWCVKLPISCACNRRANASSDSEKLSTILTPSTITAETLRVKHDRNNCAGLLLNLPVAP